MPTQNRTAQKEKHCVCLACRGTGLVSEKARGYFSQMLDLAAWAVDVRKQIEAAGAEALTATGADEDLFASVERLASPKKAGRGGLRKTSERLRLTGEDSDFLSGLGISAK